MSEVREFNEQLLLVLRAGVPMAIGDLSTPNQIEAFVAKLTDRLKSSPGSPAEIDELIENDLSLPPDYRNASMRGRVANEPFRRCNRYSNAVKLSPKCDGA